MSEKRESGASGWADPDDAPELTPVFFDRAEIREGDTVIRRGRGRPKSAEPREQIALRVDRALLQRYRATGPGWQTRMHMALALVDRFEKDITTTEEQLAWLRGDGSLNLDDGRGWREISDERIAGLQTAIVELRNAIQIALQAAG